MGRKKGILKKFYMIDSLVMFLFEKSGLAFAHVLVRHD